MKRYYSHYTFIYPNIYLKNYIVELDDENHIVNYFPFEKEIEKTEFYSGWLVFVEEGVDFNNKNISLLAEAKQILQKNISYNIFTGDSLLKLTLI